jgi:hypothetical protein
MQIAEWSSPIRIINSVENFILQAVQFQEMSICCKLLGMVGISHSWLDYYLGKDDYNVSA